MTKQQFSLPVLYCGISQLSSAKSHIYEVSKEVRIVTITWVRYDKSYKSKTARKLVRPRKCLATEPERLAFLADAQEAMPWCWCGCCGAEVYEKGNTLCPDCRTEIILNTNLNGTSAI